MARHNEYNPEYIDKVDEYLSSHQDEEVEVVKQRNDEKGYEMLDHKLKVKLPTIEGFARFIDVSKKSLYNWEKQHPEFLHALDKIRVEQQERLINYGLSGDYNSTIAKLVLSSNHGMREKTDSDIKFPGGVNITFDKAFNASNTTQEAGGDSSESSEVQSN